MTKSAWRLPTSAAFAAFSAVISAACTGEIGNATGVDGPGAGNGGNPGGGGATGSGSSSSSGSATGSGSSPGVIPPAPECAENADPGETPLLKLTTVEYRNTVRDLLAASGASKVTSGLASALSGVPDDSLGSSFRVLDDRISLEHVQGYFNVGVAVGNAVRDDAEVLRAIGGECASAATLTDTCVRGFIDGFARRAYRRPLSNAEASELTALNDGVRSSKDALRAMVIVAMSSPRFVNHVEIDGEPEGGSADLFRIDGYEIASRLSYLFWQTMPDAALFAAAEDGSLATDDGFSEQLTRVFADPRTKDTLFQFWNEWFRLEKFTGFETTRPGFQALAEGLPIGPAGTDYYADMVKEVRDLTELFTFDGPKTLSELIVTDVSVTRSQNLARLYGATAWSGSGEYPRMPAGTRAGILQRAALLVSNLELTNPFHRGAMVRRNLLCDPLPQPDPNSLPPGSLDPPPVTAAQTTRQRYQAKIEGKSLCAGCHNGFADIGYVLESFDALGRYRTTERIFDEETGELLAERPIDATGVPHVTPGDEARVDGAAQLNQKLVDSDKVEACMASKYFSFATRRIAAAGSWDGCAIDELEKNLRDPSVGLAGAFLQVTRQASFAMRKVGAR
jgi:hypothetical protein